MDLEGGLPLVPLICAEEAQMVDVRRPSSVGTQCGVEFRTNHRRGCCTARLLPIHIFLGRTSHLQPTLDHHDAGLKGRHSRNATTHVHPAKFSYFYAFSFSMRCQA